MNHAQSGVQCKILPHGEVAIDLKAIRTTVKQTLLVENEPKHNDIKGVVKEKHF